MILLYPGSFNPLHAGHLAIVHWAEKRFNQEVWFDVAKLAFGKNEVDEVEYEQRKQQFFDLGRKCLCTEEKTFIRKEKFIREKTYYKNADKYFLVGIDTILRIDDPKFYFGSELERDRVINLYEVNTRFVVFPRSGKSLSNITLSPNLRSKCIEAEGFVPVDISSSELRSKEKKNGL